MSLLSTTEMPALAERDARIVTARLELKPLLRDHAEEMFSTLSDVLLYEHTRGVPPASVSELHARYTYLESRLAPDGTEAWLNWVLVEIATGMSIGYVQVTVTSQHADIAWVVGTRWQRRGFATEAANAVVVWLRCAGVRAVRAKIHPMHAASQRVAANAGLSLTHETIEGECVWVRRI